MDFDINTDNLIDDIERIVWENDMNYIDAIVHYCDINDIDVESLASIIPSSLRAKVGDDARERRMLKREFNNISVLPV